MSLVCYNCQAEIDQNSKNRQSFLSRTNTFSTSGESEEPSFSDNGEGTDLVTKIPEVVINTNGKGCGVSSMEFPRKMGESHNSPASEIWRKFVQTTTGHGFARMVDTNEHWHLRAFWMIVVVLLGAGLLTSVSMISYESLVVRGLQREFIVQYNNTMNLPDIHICDTSLFSLSALESMGFNKTMGSYLALTLSPMLASRSLRKDKKKRQQLESLYRRLMANKTIHEVYEKATLKYEKP
ncbi:uncharacterized protein LOC124311381 [Daphnia pulicaria]|uniref:uncharacterized protein LOC124311381 n=1 Tax=Daphnia pulicaria TaxID=35523 RepID=UPI001EEA23E4|nr:uncharacterized protein LOC124311381 [Daphnia pulicaria]